jgi:hypothetical protein
MGKSSDNRALAALMDTLAEADKPLSKMGAAALYGYSLALFLEHHITQEEHMAFLKKLPLSVEEIDAMGI